VSGSIESWPIYENHADPFGTFDKLPNEQNKLYSVKTEWIIVNAWDDGSFIGNLGSRDPTLDGWTVAGSVNGHFDPAYLGNNEYTTFKSIKQGLGFQCENASYLHNACFQVDIANKIYTKQGPTNPPQIAQSPSVPPPPPPREVTSQIPPQLLNKWNTSIEQYKISLRNLFTPSSPRNDTFTNTYNRLVYIVNNQINLLKELSENGVTIVLPAAENKDLELVDDNKHDLAGFNAMGQWKNAVSTGFVGNGPNKYKQYLQDNISTSNIGPNSEFQQLSKITAEKIRRDNDSGNFKIYVWGANIHNYTTGGRGGRGQAKTVFPIINGNPDLKCNFFGLITTPYGRNLKEINFEQLSWGNNTGVDLNESVGVNPNNPNNPNNHMYQIPLLFFK